MMGPRLYPTSTSVLPATAPATATTGTRSPPVGVDPCLPLGSLTISLAGCLVPSPLLAVQHEGLKRHLQPAEVPQGLLHRTVAVRSAPPIIPPSPAPVSFPNCRHCPPRGNYESIDLYREDVGLRYGRQLRAPRVSPCIGGGRGTAPRAAMSHPCSIVPAVGAWVSCIWGRGGVLTAQLFDPDSGVSPTGARA